jgi:hypothetical protein
MIFKLIMRGELRYYSCLLSFRDAILVVGVIEWFFVRFSAMHWAFVGWTSFVL